MTWAEAAPTDGAVLYQSLCAVCHGVEAKGDGPAAAALKQLPPDLTMLSARNDGEFPAKKVNMAIREGGASAHGSAEMPVWGPALTDVRIDRKVSERETRALMRIENLTKYLESIQTKY